MIPIKKLVVLLLFVLFTGVVLAEKSANLTYDPFSYLEGPAAKSSRKVNQKASVTKEVKWQRELRATIVAGESSVANIDGKVVRIGGKVDGYTLIVVEKRKAVFKKNNSRVVLKMTPNRKKK